MSSEELSIFERMGLPPEIIRDQPLETVHIRLGEIVPTRAGGKTKPQALDYFKLVKVSPGGDDLGDLPQFKGKKVRQLPVRLCSNAIEDNFRAGISAWDGLTGPFCYNRKGGSVANRRDKHGNYNPCPCDRTRCPLWLNRKGDSMTVKQQLERGDPQRGIKPGEFAAEYPYAKITRDLKCSPEMYLFCEVDGVTLPGEVARLYTGSENSIRQVLSSLARIAGRTGGIIAGIPLFLTIAMRRSKMSKEMRVPTIGFTLRTADDNEIRALVMDTVRARELSGVTASQTRALLARKTMEELTGVDAQYIASHHLEGEQRDAALEEVDTEKPIDADAVVVDMNEIEDQQGSEWVNVCDDDIVDELCTRLGFNQARRDSVAMQARGDIDKARNFLKAMAQQKKIEVGDLFGEEKQEEPTPEPAAELAETPATEEEQPEAVTPAEPQSTVQQHPVEDEPDTPAITDDLAAQIEEQSAAAQQEQEPAPATGLQPPVNADGSIYEPPAEEPAAAPQQQEPIDAEFTEIPNDPDPDDVLTDLGPPLDMSDNPLNPGGGQDEFNF